MKWPWVRRTDYERERDAAEFLRKQLQVNYQSGGDNLLRAKAGEDRAKRAEELLVATEARHEREQVRAETRYADLMSSYRLLRLQGFSDPTATPKPFEAPKQDPVTMAINRASRGDPELRRVMMAKVAETRREKPDITDVEIVDQINRGHRPAEEMQ